MTPIAEELKEQLSRLPLLDRAELAQYLLASLIEHSDDVAEAAWDAELSRRGDEIRSGQVIGEPAATVFSRLSQRRR